MAKTKANATAYASRKEIALTNATHTCANNTSTVSVSAQKNAIKYIILKIIFLFSTIHIFVPCAPCVAFQASVMVFNSLNRFVVAARESLNAFPMESMRR